MLLSVVFGLFITVSLTAQTIVGTPHDLSKPADGGTESVCEACHTPHATILPGNPLCYIFLPWWMCIIPLWNHQTTTASFSMYNNSTSTQDSTPAADGPMDGLSRMCLSCHDGTIAIKNFGGVTTETLAMGDAPYFDNNPNALLGTDLSNDHPIEIIYDAAVALADGGLWYPALQTSGLGDTIQNDMLTADRITCVSCHDVHDYSNGKFLRIANGNSQLCLTCHNK